METPQNPSGFEGLGINNVFMEVLAKHRFSVPTPIQHKAIPVALKGEDVIGIAQTGTGKTLAFGVPMMQQLWTAGKGSGLVLLPTRELAIQVDETLAKLGGPLGLRTACLIGGESVGRQVAQLKRSPHVVVATPGRLLDLIEQKVLRLDGTTILILDEADRMLDMGFAPQINRILKLLPPPQERQTMLFSATMPDDIVKIASSQMRLPVRVEVAPQGTAAEMVHQELFIVPKENKLALLSELLQQYRGSVLVFTRTKHGARKLTQAVESMGHKAAEIHANRSLAQRRMALDGFKSGKYRVLVATDIAARGIDVTGIELVLNYDLPHSADYVHRIGRTGRAGREGHAISMATPDQSSEIRDIERLIRKPLPLSKHPKLSKDMMSGPVARAIARAHRPAGRRPFGRPRFR